MKTLTRKGGTRLYHNDEERNTVEDTAENRQSSLPKPLRTFSYLFFGVVFLVGVLGWFATSGR